MADPDEVCGWVKRKLDVEGASVAELCARPVSSGTDRVFIEGLSVL